MTARYRYGETSPRNAPFKSGVAVQICDLCYLDSADSYKIKPAGSFTWTAAVSDPSAPTVAASAASRGTALTNAATGVKVSVQFPWGEGALSSAGSATPTAAYGLKVTLAALPAPGLWWNVYVEDSAGSGTYKLQQITTVSGGIIYVDSYGTGQLPGAGNASGSAVTAAATDVTQFYFAAQFVGVAAQRYDGTNDTAYGIKDAQLRYDTGGVFSFDCASASFKSGDLVGPAKASGNALEPQKVVAVAHRTLAIGRVVKPTSSETTVLVEVFPGQRSALTAGVFPAP